MFQEYLEIIYAKKKKIFHFYGISGIIVNKQHLPKDAELLYSIFQEMPEGCAGTGRDRTSFQTRGIS